MNTLTPPADAREASHPTANTNHPWIPQPWIVKEVQRETEDVYTWRMRPLHGSAPAFQPGQFNMLYAFGQGEVAISISGVCDNGDLLHTIRAVGAVTRHMQSIAADTIIGVRGPYGNGWPTEALLGHDVVLVAGGLGLAPLRPLLEWLLRHRHHIGRFHLIYGAKHPGDLLYRQDWQRWRVAGADVRITVDTADRYWDGEVGTVTHLLPALKLDPTRTLVASCGPEPMMHFTALSLQQQGLTADAIYLSMERHMQCAVGYCGHCLYGPHFICRDGPVFTLDRLHGGLAIDEL